MTRRSDSLTVLVRDRRLARDKRAIVTKSMTEVVPNFWTA